MLKYTGDLIVDHSQQPAEGQRAAFFDIDGTLTNAHVWKGMLDYFQQRGERQAVHWLYMAVHYPLYFLRRLRLISESAFRAPWSEHLAWYVRGYSLEQADALWEWTVTKFLSRHWRADSRALLDQRLRAGELVMLVSSGPLPLVQRIADELGAAHAIGTRFEIQGNRYTGRSLPPVCIGDAKASLPLEYLRARRLKVDLGASFAFADSLADLPMLEMVGQPVAVYPEAGLRRLAERRGWQIFPAPAS
ncbi:MAG: HAD-IB family hydrolase [Anaerolineales bacterium]|nr:HAD-IB family hydrolase [Anaerolineales bacterium]